jgi:hypothetical protein
MIVRDAGIEPRMKESVDQAHSGDDDCAEEEPHAAFAPGFVPIALFCAKRITSALWRIWEPRYCRN